MIKPLDSHIRLRLKPFLSLFGQKSLSSKFRFIYLFFIILCTSINIIFVTFFYNYLVSKSINSLANQTFDTVSGSCDSMISIVSKSSTYLLGSSDVQSYLKTNTSESKKTILAKQLRNTLYLSLESMPSISSIIIMKEDSTFEYASRYTLPSIQIDDLSKVNWYSVVHNLHGTPYFVLDGGGIYKRSPEQEKYLSLIRLVNSTETVETLGYMIINIPVSSLIDTSSINYNSSDFCVYSNDKPVLSFKNPSLNTYFQTHSVDELCTDGQTITRINGGRYIILSKNDTALGLTYYSVTPCLLLSGNYVSFLFVCIVSILFSIVMFIPIAYCTNHFVTKPISRLNKAMKITEKGDFSTVNITPYQDEIGNLQSTYNEMIQEIKSLLNTKIEEQKKLRNAELKILQEQIKPHFLYNSLNGISSLINSQQNQVASEMILTLSNYYRESLSKGSEIIPLNKEVNIVKNYLHLQKMRFPDIFDDEYHIADNTADILVPRLFLQPLVENSLYHGIIPTCDYGIIRIDSYIDSDNLILKISDDGIGIAHETLKNITSDTTEYQTNSFGLRGTIERLNIFYDTENICDITSTVNKGTLIMFSIPLAKIKETKMSYDSDKKGK